MDEYLTEQDDQDIEIAANAALDMLEQAGADGKTGGQIVGELFTKSNPGKMVAMFLMSMGKAVHAQHEDVGLNPEIWLAEGGVLDEITDELQDAADQAGASVDVAALMPEIKQHLIELVKLEEQQGQAEQPEQQQAQPGKYAGGNRPIVSAEV